MRSSSARLPRLTTLTLTNIFTPRHDGIHLIGWFGDVLRVLSSNRDHHGFSGIDPVADRPAHAGHVDAEGGHVLHAAFGRACLLGKRSQPAYGPDDLAVCELPSLWDARHGII